MEGVTESALSSDVGVESDVLTLIPDPPVARVQLRLLPPFPEGDWLTVTASARLFDPQDATSGRFDRPLAAGPEVEAHARSKTWSVVDLPLPRVVRREYAVVGKVFSADPRYRRTFVPSACRVVAATFGSLVRVPQEVLDDIYTRGGYDNPIAEDEIKHWVREGVVVAVDRDGRLHRAVEVDGRLGFEPLHHR